MKKIFRISSVILLLSILMACGNSELKVYDSTEKLVEDAKSEVEFISAETLKSVIENESHFYLIDCREEEEYNLATIKGAINVPKGLLEFQIGNKVPERRANVYIFCSDEQKAVLAASVLPELKFPNVKVLEGGFNAWESNYPELVELEPAGDSNKAVVPAAGSGGCGG
jgi:rhodanese-related sulfurtransferase